MSFLWPIMLVLLLLVPLLVVQYTRMQQRRQRILANYGSLGIVQEAAGRRLGARRHLPPLLFLSGLTILMLAVARPQAVVSLPRVEGTVMLVFDVSGSMAAEDIKPTRMEAAKAAASAFVERQPDGVLIGVVAFSDGALTVQAPTDDQASLLAAIHRLSPQRGTSLGSGILAALNTVIEPPGKDLQLSDSQAPPPTPTPLPRGMYEPAIIALLSDGENNEAPNPFAVAQAAADRGVRIYTIGIGSTAGITLQLDDFSVHTQLDEALLQQIALITDGDYYNAQTEQDLQTIYRSLTSHLVIKPEEMEVTSIFAGAGVLVLLIGGICSLLWFSRMP
jgi:Ca-activated chloride channel family protein